MLRCMGMVVALWLPAAAQAQTLPALDRLDAAAIPVEEQFAGQPKELVAILGTNRGRHTEPIHALAYSFDGKFLAAGDDGGTVRVWHAETLREHAVFRAHGRDITAMACSPDGQLWATASWQPGNDFGPAFEGELKVWDAGTRKQLAMFGGHKSRIWHIAFSPDAKQLSSVDDKTVSVWDLTAVPPRLQTQLRTIEASAAVFSPDGKHLITPSWTNEMRFWDSNTGKELPAPAVFGNSITACTVSGNGAVLLTGVDHTLQVWDWNAGTPKLRASLKHAQPVTLILASHDGKRLVSETMSTMHVWDLTSEPKETVKRKLGDSCVGAVLSPSGNLLSFPVGQAVRQWDVTGAAPRDSALPPGPTAASIHLAWSGDGARLIAADNREAWVWAWEGKHFKDGKLLFDEIAGGSWALSPDGCTIALTSGRQVDLWDLTRQPPNRKATIDKIEALAGPYPQLTFSSQGDLLVVASMGNGLPWQLLDFSKKPPKVLSHKLTPIWKPIFSPDGKTLAGTNHGGKVLLTGLTEKQTPWYVPDQEADARTWAFSPDGRTLAVGRGDSTVVLWEIASGKRRAEWKAAAQGGIWSLAFSPDGKHLATIANSAITVWAWGQKQWSVSLPAISQAGMLWGPDSRHLAVANANGTVYILRVPADNKRT
jgi:WD40 repeat protein